MRNLLLRFAFAMPLAVLVLIGIVAPDRRAAALWRAMARGSFVLAAAVPAAGAVFVFSFDTTFLVFHLIGFPQGNIAFDPRTARLVQLFPAQFWSDTAVAVALVAFLAAVLVGLVARWVARRMDAS